MKKMPEAHTHLLIGTAIAFAGISILYLFFEENLITAGFLIALFSVIGSLLPDIDTNSNISLFFLAGILSALILAIILKQILIISIVAVVFLIIYLLIPHRTITHNLLASLLYGWVVFALCLEITGISSIVISATATCSYLSHIIIDKI